MGIELVGLPLRGQVIHHMYTYEERCTNAIGALGEPVLGRDGIRIRPKVVGPALPHHIPLNAARADQAKGVKCICIVKIMTNIGMPGVQCCQPGARRQGRSVECRTELASAMCAGYDICSYIIDD